MKRMPMTSRIFFLFSAVMVIAGSFAADYFSVTHIYNPQWPPHARFHTGQTLSMSILLGVMSVFFAWRKTIDQRTTTYAAAGFGALYFLSQSTAIFYPGTAYNDPVFAASVPAPLGIPIVIYLQVLFLAIVAIATWLALRKGARWTE